MIRTLLLAALAILPILPGGCARAPGDEQSLVDRATLSIQEMMNQNSSTEPQSMLRKAKAVMICPRVFKAGFFVGGEGGGCVLLARAGNGTWSYPAFYGLGSGSFGLQIGVEDSQLLLMIMTEKGLGALMDSQVKLGANASIAIASVGASVQGATTTAVGADIVAFALSRGLFGGIALEGSVMSSRTEWNEAYYRQPYGARQIVLQMQGVNGGADPLRGVLTRYGAALGPVSTGQPSVPPPTSGYAPAYPSQPLQGAPVVPSTATQPGYLPAVPPAYQPAASAVSGARGPIQQQQLAPPR